CINGKLTRSFSCGRIEMDLEQMIFTFGAQYFSRLSTSSNRLLRTTPRPGCEIGESSAAAAARQPDVALEESSEFCTDITIPKGSCILTLEARITLLETEARRHEWQRQAADDLAVQHIHASVKFYGLLPVSIGLRRSCVGCIFAMVNKMAPKRATRSTRAPPTPNEPTTTVTEAQLQALIDQGVAAAMAEAEASRVRNGYNSNGSDKAQPKLLANALTPES
ncbi:hypothetical protein Tco_0415378, partial [Tanacetum coccineum]